MALVENTHSSHLHFFLATTSHTASYTDGWLQVAVPDTTQHNSLSPSVDGGEQDYNIMSNVTTSHGVLVFEHSKNFRQANGAQAEIACGVIAYYAKVEVNTYRNSRNVCFYVFSME